MADLAARVACALLTHKHRPAREPRPWAGVQDDVRCALAIVIFAAALLAPTRASARCVLGGEAIIERVRIALAEGEKPLELGVREHAVSVSPIGGGRVRVKSRSELVWSGIAAEDAVSVFLARKVPLAQGAVRVRPPTQLDGLELPIRGDPRVDIKLAPGVWIPDTKLRCEALTLDRDVWSNGTSGRLSRSRAGYVASRGDSLRVYADPGGPSLRIALKGGKPLALARVERAEGWYRVRRRFADGSAIDGWVRSQEVEPAERPPPREEAMTMPGGCWRGSSHTYRGAATLAVGAELRTEAEGLTWAVTKAEMDVRVAVKWGAEWARIETIPGLVGPGQCPNLLERAWVPTGELRRVDGYPFP